MIATELSFVGTVMRIGITLVGLGALALIAAGICKLWGWDAFWIK